MTARCGEDFGAATITWLSQVSFQPPLVAAAIRENSSVFRCLVASGTAAVHMIASDQTNLAQRFFCPTRAAEGKINGEPFVSGPNGLPILPSTPAHIECRLIHATRHVGDHALVVMEVMDAVWRAASRPLTVAESPWEYGG